MRDIDLSRRAYLGTTLAVFTPIIQYMCSILFVTYFSSWSNAVRIISCVIYPLGIFICQRIAGIHLLLALTIHASMPSSAHTKDNVDDCE
jgi:hypothetical protein